MKGCRNIGSKFFTPARFVWEGPQEIVTATETEIKKAKEGIPEALKTLDVASATKTAKSDIDQAAASALKKLRPDPETAKTNSEYIQTVLRLQKEAKSEIDANLQRYKNVEKYLDAESSAKVMLSKAKDDFEQMPAENTPAALKKLISMSSDLEKKRTVLEGIDLLLDPSIESARDALSRDISSFTQRVDTRVGEVQQGLTSQISDVTQAVGDVASKLNEKGVAPLEDITTLQEKENILAGLLDGLKKVPGQDELVKITSGALDDLRQIVSDAKKALAETDQSGKLGKEMEKEASLRRNFEAARANLDQVRAAGKNSPDYQQKMKAAMGWYRGAQKAYADQQLKVSMMTGDVDRINRGTGVYEKGVFEEQQLPADFTAEGVDATAKKNVDRLTNIGDGYRIEVNGVEVYITRIAKKGETQYAISTQYNDTLGISKDIQGSKEFILKEASRLAAEKKPAPAPAPAATVAADEPKGGAKHG